MRPLLALIASFAGSALGACGASEATVTACEPNDPGIGEAGDACLYPCDCASVACLNNVCQVPTCTDTLHNGAEADVDCGGVCPPCADGRVCAAADDCVSLVCEAARCEVAVCDDAVHNGLESDVDCGGTCTLCAEGDACERAADCTTGRCLGGLCGAAGSHRLALGRQHSCAVTPGGDVRCWGNNQLGQLGDGSFEERLTPVVVAGLPEDAVALVALGYSTCALTSGGEVYCWGLHMGGQLGVGADPRLVDCAWNSASTLCATSPLKVPGLVGVQGMSEAGMATVCALVAGGDVRCWGHNGDGELGLGTSTGPEQCGPANYVYDCSSTPAAPVALAQEAAVIGYGCAATATGELWCWGSNDSARLGLGTSEGPAVCGSGACGPSPVRVGDLAGVEVRDVAGSWAHTCALSATGAIWCWGLNAYGELGTSSIESERPTPALIAADGPFVALGSSLEVACAVEVSGSIRCWGANEAGQLGLGTSDGPDACGSPGSPRSCSRSPVAVTSFGTAVEVRPGPSHVCALDVHGAAWCWGNNSHGQLGNGSRDRTAVPVAVAP